MGCQCYKKEDAFNQMANGVDWQKSGGLGVRNLRLYIKSLLFKWLQRYMLGGDVIWKRLMSAIYGNKGGWRPPSLHMNARGDI